MTWEDLFGQSQEFYAKAAEWTRRISGNKPAAAVPLVLGGILLSLQQLIEASKFGNTYFRISPYVLTSTPARIVEREPQGRLRKVSISIDSAVGGVTPAIRLGGSASNATGSGIRLNAGVVNEIGEVAAKAELWAASSTSIACYVIERA